MTDAVTDKDKLLELLQSNRSCIRPYKTADSLFDLSSSTSLKDSDPITEIKKLSQIIKAHSTKIGIICQEDKFYRNLSAVFNELKSFNDKIFMLLSLLPLFHKDKEDKWAQFFIQTLNSLVINLLNGISTLYDEIDRLLNGTDNEKDQRLYAVGLIWAACDSLDNLAHKGNFQILADNIRNNCSLVDDVMEDISSWLEDPQMGNDLLLGDEDEEDDNNDEDSSRSQDGQEILEQMKCFLKDWETNLKMIKLLLSSFAKPLSSNIYTSKDSKGSTLDKLNDIQHKVIEQIDELISDFLVSDLSFNSDDFEDDIAQLNESLRKMVDTIKILNKSDPKKSKWIQVWENKYFQEKS